MFIDVSMSGDQFYSSLNLALFLELNNGVPVDLVCMNLSVEVQYLLIPLQLDRLWVLPKAIKVCFVPFISGCLARLLRQEYSVVPGEKMSIRCPGKGMSSGFKC